VSNTTVCNGDRFEDVPGPFGANEKADRRRAAMKKLAVKQSKHYATVCQVRGVGTYKVDLNGEQWIPNTQGPEGKLGMRIAAFDGEGEKDAAPFPWSS
jgi:hypothetical protein